MGSLASRPKAPQIQSQPLPIYVPAPASAVMPPVTGGGNVPDAVPDNESIMAQARSLGLLDRARGSLSTVLTGFRGILGQSEAAPQRKTLLGE